MNKIYNTLAIALITLTSACGVNNQEIIMPEIPTNNQVSAESFNGVYMEIENGILAAFSDLDADENKGISPAEFGVDSSTKMVSFREADKNRDGNITIFEFMPDELAKIKHMTRTRSNANNLFEIMDKKPRDNKLSEEEVSSGLVAEVFSAFFGEYDQEKNSQNYLSKSEFQNLFAFASFANYPENLTAESFLKTSGLKIKNPKNQK